MQVGMMKQVSIHLPLRQYPKYHMYLYKYAFWQLHYNKHAERARKETIESLKRDSVLMRSRRPLQISGGKPLISITLRNAVSGVTHEVGFEVGTTYKKFFHEVRERFGHPKTATSISVAVSDPSGKPFEGKSEKILETELNDSTLLCGFHR